jgi:membrane associated rhomboid family serine protease
VKILKTRFEKSGIRGYVSRDRSEIGFMLEDRYYMRRSAFRPSLSVTVVLVITNVIAFILQLFLSRLPDFPTNGYFALSLDGLRHGYIWQIMTFQLMHAGPLHLLGNCLTIYMLGREVEAALGRWPYLVLYVSSGVIGGLLELLAGLAFGGPFAVQVLGASAGAFGVTAAFAILFPNQMLMFPPMRAKYLLLVCGLLSILGILGLVMPGTAHAAHLGGMLTGMAFVRYAAHWDWHWPKLRRASGTSRRRLVKVATPSSRWGRTSNAAPAEDLPTEEFVSREVDPILDKISAHGIQSLTERERRVLEAARQKIKR